MVKDSLPGRCGHLAFHRYYGRIGDLDDGGVFHSGFMRFYEQARRIEGGREPSAERTLAQTLEFIRPGIRFKETQIRAMGRNAAGVRGLRIKGKDQVIGMEVLPLKDSGQVLVVMGNGFGKRTSLSAYKVQGRGGSGIKTAKVTDKTGKIVAAMRVDSKIDPEVGPQDMVIISSKGQVIRLPLKSVSVLGRATQGVRLMRFKEDGDKVASVTLV